MSLQIEFDREDDGRWIAEVPSLPGVLAYGENLHDLALRVLIDKIEHGEPDHP
jgi:predicted RNase H-like HicB family nuclease